MRAPSDYCVLNGDPKARLSDIERLTLIGEAGLDRLINRFARQFATLSLEGMIPDLTVEKLQEALNNFREDPPPTSEFVAPTNVPSAQITPVHGVQDGTIFDISFPSAFAQHSPLVQPAANGTVHVRLWEHVAGASATIVAIHGWSMGDQKVNSLAFLPGLFYSLGYNVAVIELPFHGQRADLNDTTPAFPSLNSKRTAYALEQVISDLREVVLLFKQRGHHDFGCMGLSLGAYVGALWSSLDKLKFGIFVVPLVSMGDLAWELSRSRFGKDALQSAAITRQRLRELFHFHSPLTRPSATPEERLLIVAGRGDKVVPRQQVALLRRRWPGALVKWVTGGHAAHFKKGHSLQIILEFLKSLDDMDA